RQMRSGLGHRHFDDVPTIVRRRMSSIRKTNTVPELVVRRLVHRLGFRFRIHRKDLPGTPDLVFPRLRKVIFVHGCFWHQHRGCPSATKPSVRGEYWLPKLDRNKRRDVRVVAELTEMGWDSLVIWECETKDLDKITHAVQRFLVNRASILG